MIVNAFIMKWKKWKNLVKSYLTIPVLWAQLIFLINFSLEFSSSLIRVVYSNGNQTSQIHPHKVLTHRLRL